MSPPPDDPAQEEQLIAAIVAHQDDEPTRLVYADWLEERSDARGEYLRLEAQMHRIVPRLAELIQSIDPAWLARVGRRRAVVMIQAGPMKINCIKEVRAITGHGLTEAKRLVDMASPSSPQLVRGNLLPDEAENIRKQLAEWSQVQVVPWNPPR